MTVIADERPLLFDKLTAEWALAHATHASVAAELERYRNALGGIASCSTACGCCRLHVELALRALNEKL